MSDIVTEILAEKLEKPEKLAAAGMNDYIRRALEEVKDTGAKKIAVIDILNETIKFWIISSWNQRLLNPNVSFRQAFDQRREIFESVKAVSKEDIFSSDARAKYDATIKIITDLFELPGLIVFEGNKIKGFISLANFSESEYEKIESFKKSFLTIEQIKQKAKLKGALASIGLHGSYEGIDLRDSDLRGVDFSKAELRKAILRGADLTKANLSGADLTNANLIRARLDGAILKDAILIEANLSYTQLWHANLENAQLQGAILQESVLFGANLKFANLENANLFNAGLMSANFEGADLSNADIRNANLKGATFNENTKLNDVEINSITIDNLTESALKANWSPEIKQIIIEKYIGNSFVLKTTSFFKKEYQEKYRNIVMEKTGALPEKVYNIHAIIDSTIENALEKVDHVEYFLPSHPGTSGHQIKSDYKDKFQLKDLAYTDIYIYAEVYLKGKDEPIRLREFITLKESSPRLL